MNNIRNFCIIAHIDHGKSTLADRLLEYTGTISKREMKDQILDAMELERERGITIKAKAVRMNYKDKDGKEYILNLVDTPGHVDFTYEVSRALEACEGALLIIDASQGVEAQTLANTMLAKNANLKIIPVINKIDLPTADVDAAYEQMKEGLSVDAEPILASAKEGIGISEIIDSVIANVPAPQGKEEEPLSALIFDSFYDSYRGVITIIRIFDGKIKKGMKIKFMASDAEHEVLEVGYLKPKMIESNELSAGEVGYVVAGIKTIRDIKIGDTITELLRPTQHPHEGYKEINPFVFAGLYPYSSSDYDSLKMALEKLQLSDSSLVYVPETSVALGFGYRCGFLGHLHLDIVKERLLREFDLNLLVTAPNVIYKIKVKDKYVTIDNPAKFPLNADIQEIWEPYVKATVICPNEYIGAVMDLCQKRRGKQTDMKYLDMRIVILKYELPLAEIIVGFYDSLKSISKGYASFDYEHIASQLGDLVKLEILVNSEVVDAFSVITHKDKAQTAAHFLTEKLKDIIPRHMFEIPIQARVNNKIIARETISAMRKDVLAKCYGGDITRKRKLLEKQKEGKKKMRQFGRVELPPEAFVAVLQIDD
ncbi:MAG: translation elongation factor 4 [Endomicrobiaceae bacterium]|jgi:GTP-binding protein LepA|nr:translation elongation factor 4 [Endomicrobiaceae bacterium]MDD3730028.1 translation elongation factor 4 [Endomicrobiaceae bacterium]MDD4166052.1 translation elongation factor 4 [Endomicrobiaceae bacterium]